MDKNKISDVTNSEHTSKEIANQTIEYDQITSDPGGNLAKRSEKFSDAGDDSLPLDGDKAILVNIRRAGGAVVVGFVDLKNKGVAEKGEKRIYSRDGDGDVIAEVHLKNDGEITVKNDNGSIDLRPNGNVNINGVVIDTDGNITTDGDIEGSEVTATSTNVGLATHQHPTAATGPPSSPTPGT